VLEVVGYDLNDKEDVLDNVSEKKNAECKFSSRRPRDDPTVDWHLIGLWRRMETKQQLRNLEGYV